MTTWTVILFAVALVWTLLLAVIMVTLADKEKKEKKKLEEREETLRRMEYAFRLREDNYKEALEVFNREKEQFKERELNLAARKESVLELEATLTKKQIYLAGLESQLKEKEAEIKAACIPVVPEIPDIIEPADEPAKVSFGSVNVKRCPRCGKDMEMKTDVCYTSIPPQYKYICPECGYEEVDTCPPTHNLVGTDKKPVKKARRAKK